MGAGDSALDAANYLSNVAEKVYVIQRTGHPIGGEETIQNLRSRPNVEFVNNTVVSQINGTTKVQSVRLRSAVPVKDGSNAESDLSLAGVFIEMGYITKTAFLKELVQLNGLGEIITDKDGKTSTVGIFAAGDVTDVSYKQAVISAAQGAAAALSAYNYIQKLKGRPTSRSDWKSIRAKV